MMSSSRKKKPKTEERNWVVGEGTIKKILQKDGRGRNQGFPPTTPKTQEPKKVPTSNKRFAVSSKGGTEYELKLGICRKWGAPLASEYPT